MQGIHPHSTILRTQKVLQERTVQTQRGTKKVKSSLPEHQATTHVHQNVYYTNDFKSVPTNLFRNSGSRYCGNIEQKAFSKMKSASLKIVLNITGSANTYCRLAPVPYFFDRIEIRTQNGSKHLGIIRAEIEVGIYRTCADGGLEHF